MNYRYVFSLIISILLTSQVFSEEKVYLIPSTFMNVKQPSIVLNGAWQFQFSPGSKWTSIQVPGEAAMQGYAIEHDKPFRYRKLFTLPADYRGKRVILRFDGVYSQARLWVNGVFVREHHGGFTRWETDVTSFVKVGKTNVIELEVTDRVDEISYASGYAHHPIGGILRDVTIFAIPQTYVYDFRMETRMDEQYKDATLHVSYSSEGSDGEIEYTLAAPNGQPVALANNRFPLSGKSGETHDFPVKAPLKWDAEHPNLYTLTATIYQNGKEVSRFTQKVGFRDIKIVKNQLFVNGSPVKLRGACRHDMHPTLGRMTTVELDSLDAVLFKQSNMNFVRTSHYPCSEKFLEYCDRFGIYVESETAVCFVQSHRQGIYNPSDTQDKADYANRYLSQFQEMVKTFRSHPSILIWSLGNESVSGSNFKQCRDWLPAADTTRPSIFSYPGLQKDEPKIYDILSMHYQDLWGNLEQHGMRTSGFQGHGIPALFDEWAHVPCYTYATLKEDPNIREFWGISLDRMWENIFKAPGGLGGAIWGYIDETFMLPEPKAGKPAWKEYGKREGEDYTGNCVGYGEWGIVDVWRRQKPEFWSTKKAYSPVRLLTERITDFTGGERLLLPVHNRFDHTNLNEIVVGYTYGGVEKTLKPASIAPHRQGLIQIPGEDWKEGELLLIRFFTANNELIDACIVALGPETPRRFTKQAESPLNVEETGDYLTVKGRNFEIPFQKSTGLIVNATSHEEVIIEQGPFLNLDIYKRLILSENDWKKNNFSYKKENQQVKISLSGSYKEVSVDFDISISAQGEIQTNYMITGAPDGYSVREMGLKFILPESIENLEWKRKGYWSYYPENSFAGNEGTATLYGSKQAAYGQPPVQDWALDTHNYFYWGDVGANCKKPLTQMAKGMKENIYRYTISTKTKQASLSVLSSDASVACRINKNEQEQLLLYANSRWDYPEIGWGDYCKALEANPGYGGIKIELK
ncbi:beta-galactosidase [Bacteroidia bacterium]|nr:beta-galactosidase [Bacteroidia bacterium]